MKKITLLLILFVITGLNAQTKKTAKTAATGTMKGTVTFEKKLYEDRKPDAGATILIHKSDVQVDSPQDTISNFIVINKLKKLYESTNDEAYLKMLQSKNADTKEKYELIAERAMNYEINVKNDPKTITLTTDALGNYSVQLAPGRYEIIFESANLKALNILEGTGRVYSYLIEIKKGQTVIQDHKFNKLYE